MKLKWKFSLDKWLRNDKVMIVVSLIIAIILWAVVLDNAAFEGDKVVEIPVNVSLTNPIAKEKDLRIITQSLETVKVTVTGPYFQVSSIREEDIELRINTSSIYTAGYYQLQIEAAKVGNKKFTIESLSSGTIGLQCDFWEGAKEFAVQTDISGITVTDEGRYRLGDPQLDASLAGGIVTVAGPKAVVDQIVSIVARVSHTGAIADTQVYEAPLIALDQTGNELDLEQCEISNSTVTVTVPVLEYRRVDFQYSLEHVPAAYANRTGFLTVTPAFVELWGPPDTIQQFADSIQNLGVFDFDHLTPANADRTISLNVPSAVKVIDGSTAVTVDFDMDGFATRTFDLTLSESNLEILNQPEGKEIRVPQPLLTGIQICGPERVLSSIKESDLRVTLDMKGNTASGASRYEARVTVRGRNDVWTYYGEDAAGYELYITVQ